MKALFKSLELQRKFEDDGFVKVGLLTQAEVAGLMTAYKTVATEHEKINIPYITTSHSNDSELITRVDKILQEIIAPAVNQYLINYKLLFGNYLIKMPGTGSETAPHQDITFVDESQYTSVNIWVALQDTNEENGCMYFLRGSHTLMNTLRPTHDYKWVYQNVSEEIKRQSESFPAKAGEAFIFNHATVHGSFSNKTSFPRVAAVIAAYHNEAELIHYYLPDVEKSQVQKYRMTKEAFLHFKKGCPPAKGVFVEEVNYDFRQLNLNEFEALIKKKMKRIISLIRSISNPFKYSEKGAHG